jgi:polysaccharide biosynthesis transport protein
VKIDALLDTPGRRRGIIRNGLPMTMQDSAALFKAFLADRHFDREIARKREANVSEPMLEIQKSPSVDLPAPPAAERGLAEHLTAVVQLARRHYSIILLFALVGLLCGIFYLQFAPSKFTAQAQMLIDRSKSPFVQQQSIIQDVPLDTAQLESQMQILRSPGIASAVVEQLHLADDEDFVKSGRGLFGSLTGSLRDILPYFRRATPSEAQLVQQAVGILLANLSVSRVGVTYLIDISFRSTNRERAAQIANAVANEYIAEQLSVKFEANRQASEWLQARREQLRLQSAAAERAVNSYKSQNKIVDSGGKLIGDQELTQLNTQVIIARTKTSEAQARLNRIEVTLRADGADAAADATVSDALSNPVITKLRQDYLEYSNREKDYAARFGKDHLAVLNLRNKVRDLRSSIKSELQRLAETYKSDYVIAKQQQDDLEKQLAGTVAQSQLSNSAQVTLRDLEGAAQSARSLFNLFQQRLLEFTQQESFPAVEARIIAPAGVPEESRSLSYPIMVIAGFTCAGLIFGVGLGFLRDAMDRVFRTSDQVEAALGVPCVALVPLVKEDERKHRDSCDYNPSSGSVAPRTISSRGDVASTVLRSPLSPFAESIRSIKLSADLNASNSSSSVIGFTSCVPNEGKSTISCSLAQLVAQVGGRVIIIDCDLRNPNLSRRLAPTASVGLIEVLTGEKSLDEAIWVEASTRMEFLPVLRHKQLIHTSEILASASMMRLVDQLRSRYDCVVVDLPPLAPIVDARATTHLIDSYFLVIEWGRTKTELVQRALKNAHGIYEHLVGVVLNKANMKTINRYDVNNGQWYHNKYYSRYGYSA